MEHLRFRRQFLFTAIECKQLDHWNKESFDSHQLYVHPDSGLCRYKNSTFDGVFIGYVLDPKKKDRTGQEILEDLSQRKSINGIAECLFGLSGRFVLIVKNEEGFYFFNDACGLKSVFYTNVDGLLYAASQPLLLKLVTPIETGEKYDEFHTSRYVKSIGEYFVPCGTSLYKDVFQLVPNHYLDCKKISQYRYYPHRTMNLEDLDTSVGKFASILKGSMEAANEKFRLAVGMTSGWDSRTILSTCKEIADDVVFFTLKYRDMTDESDDIRIPKQLLTQLGYPHMTIDCNKPVDEAFAEIYESNSDLSHLDDWGMIGYGMSDEYPTDHVNVKGVCSEIGRCVYYPSGIHPNIKSSDDLVKLVLHWKEVGFIKDQISDWYDEFIKWNENFGYNILDLYFWEHRMGSWQAQNQLEWDILQEAFSPFNNRELLDTMLRTEPGYRCYPDYVFVRKAIETLWEETLSIPIKPKNLSRRIKDLIKSTFYKLGMYSLFQQVFKKTPV